MRNAGECLVEQMHEVRESIAEKAADAHGDIHARSAKLREGHYLEAPHSATLHLPDRPHAEQVQDLRHVFAVRAHSGGAPDDDAHGLGVTTLLGEILVEQGLAELLADFPGGWRGDGV